MLAEVVIAIARAGDLDHAETLGSTITDSVEPDVTDVLRAAVAAAKDPNRAEVLSRPSQAQALGYLATVIAQAGDLDRARRLLAQALIMDPPDIWWVKTVSRFFPSAIGSAWDILADVYTTRA